MQRGLTSRTVSGATNRTQVTDPQDGDYEPSSQASSHIDTPKNSQDAVYTAVELARIKQIDGWRRIKVDRLNKLPVVRKGWCELVDMATNKSKLSVPIEKRIGHVQLSWDNHNHVSDAFFELT